MREAETLPIVVLTGFLGSGKTTLLRRAVASPAFADTAVVINEIGEIGIDHYLVDFVEGGVVELPGGCLCCAVREDLARTLRSLLERRETGEIRAFSRIVVETTGLADPGPILFTLGSDPMLDQCLRLARIVTLVDASDGAAALDRFSEAARQVAVADLIIVTKTDLAPFGSDLAGRLDAANRGAPRLISADAADPAALLFAPTQPSPAGGGGRERGQGVGALPAAEAAHSHGIDTFAVTLGEPVGRLDFAMALGGLARARGNDLLRVKGIVEFADRLGRPAVVQAAQHAMFAPEWLEDWPVGWPAGEPRSRLVFIVHDIPRSEILAHFAFAAPSVGQPSH